MTFLAALQNWLGHQAAFSIVGHGNIGKQITIKSVSPEFQEQIRFLAVQEVLLVEPAYLLKRRLANEQTASIQKCGPNRFRKELLALQ